MFVYLDQRDVFTLAILLVMVGLLAFVGAGSLMRGAIA